MEKRKAMWRFSVEADQLPNGYHRVRVVSGRGRVIIREGYSPLWELIRILAKHESNIEDNGPLDQDDRPPILWPDARVPMRDDAD